MILDLLEQCEPDHQRRLKEQYAAALSHASGSPRTPSSVPAASPEHYLTAQEAHPTESGGLASAIGTSPTISPADPSRESTLGASPPQTSQAFEPPPPPGEAQLHQRATDGAIDSAQELVDRFAWKQMNVKRGMFCVAPPHGSELMPLILPKEHPFEPVSADLLILDVLFESMRENRFRCTRAAILPLTVELHHLADDAYISTLVIQKGRLEAYL